MLVTGHDWRGGSYSAMIYPTSGAVQEGEGVICIWWSAASGFSKWQKFSEFRDRFLAWSHWVIRFDMSIDWGFLGLHFRINLTFSLGMLGTCAETSQQMKFALVLRIHAIYCRMVYIVTVSFKRRFVGRPKIFPITP